MDGPIFMNAPDAVDNQARKAKKCFSVPAAGTITWQCTRYEHLLFLKKKSKEKETRAVTSSVCCIQRILPDLTYVESDEARREVAQDLDALNDCDKTDLVASFFFLLNPSPSVHSRMGNSGGKLTKGN